MNKKIIAIISTIIITAVLCFAEYYTYNPSTGGYDPHSSIGGGSQGNSGNININTEEINECLDEIDDILEEFNEEFSDDFSEDSVSEGEQSEETSDSQEEKILENEYADSEDITPGETGDVAETDNDNPPATEGDPVFIVTGQYTLKQKELEFKWGTNRFVIERDYLSFDYPEGSFGKSWNCSLDTRLVFGNPSENIVKKQELQEKIDSCRNKSSRYYQYVPALKEKIDLMQQKCDQIKTEFIIPGVTNEKTLYGKANRYSNGLKYNQILHISENGGVEVFVYDSEENCFKPTAGRFKNRVSIIYDNALNVFIVKYMNGKEKTFSSEGLPLSEKDRYGLSVEYLYDNDSFVKGITHNNREVITVKRDGNGQICTLINNISGEQITYSYKENNLKNVLDYQNDTYSYEYDENDDLKVLIKPDDSRAVINYRKVNKDNGLKKVVSAHIDEEGNAETYDYDDSGNIVTYTDADGMKTVYELEGSCIIKQTVDGNPSVSWQYNQIGLVKEKTDYFGTTEYEYNDKGLKSKEKKEDKTKLWSYSKDYGLITGYIDEENNESYWSYDKKGNCTIKRISGNSKLMYEYESWGGVKRAFSGSENNKFEYNADYNIISDNDYTYEYDSNGKLVSKVDAMNNRFTYTYECDGKKLTVVNPFGTEISYVQNNRKDIQEIISHDPVNNWFEITKFVYDKRHLVKEIFMGSGTSVEAAEKSFILKKSCEYTKAGRISKIILWNYGKARINDAPGICTEFIYDFENSSVQENKYFVDENGIRISEILSKTTVCSYADDLKKVNIITPESSILYEYGQNNKLHYLKHPDGRTEEYLYDKAGRIIEIKNVYGGTKKIKYNNDGYIKNIKYENNDEAEFQFNDDGSIKTIATKNGNRTDFTYEKNGIFSAKIKKERLGSVKKVYDSLGNMTEYVVYDKEGNKLIDETLQYGTNYRKVNVKNNGVEYEDVYDGFGRCIKSGIDKCEYEYDSDGNVVSIIRENGKTEAVTEIQYNALNDISSIKTPSGNIMNYFYNAAGKLVRKTDDEGIVWEGTYYTDGNLKSEKGRLLPQKEYFYDESGNLTGINEENDVILRINYCNEGNKVILTDANGNDYTEMYDQCGQLAEIIDRLGNKKTISYDSNVTKCNDFNGNKITVYEKPYEGKRSVEYEDGSIEEIKWNYLNQIISSMNDNAKDEYVYENNRLKKQIIDGRNYLYSYDSEGRLKTVRGSDLNEYFTYNEDGSIKQSVINNLSVSYVYDIEGREVSSYSTDGNMINKEYDSAGRIVSIEQKNDKGSLVFAEYYIYDENGRIACISDHEGKVSLFEYDKHGRIANALIPYNKEIENKFKEEYTESGDELTKNVVYKTLDLPKQFLVKLKKIWSKNKLRTPVAQNGQIVWSEQYEYDSNGNRIKKTTPAGTINYLYDKENRLVKYGNENFVSVNYDKNGNILLKDSVYRTIKMSYSLNNQLIQINNLDKKNNVSETFNYTYDALSRRITKSKNGRQIMRTVYDGFSLNPLTEYRISGKSLNDVPEGYESSERTYFPEQRSFLYVNNLLRGQTAGAEVYVFCNDIRGSIRSVNSIRKVKTDLISYDVNGNPYVTSNNKTSDILKETDSFGIDRLFCGKSYDPSVNQYDFGYRFYSSSSSRFTSTDPVQDGFNWYSYCANDPVNYYDPDGLLIRKIHRKFSMQDSNWGSDLVGNKTEAEYDNKNNVINNIANEGCAITVMADIISSSNNQDVTPKDINNEKEYFSTEKGSEDLLNMQKTGEDYGLTFDYWTSTYSNLGQKLLEIKADDSNTYIAAQVKYNNKGGTHWVSVEGTTEIDGQLYVIIDGTSQNDVKFKDDRNADGSFVYDDKGNHKGTVTRQRNSWIEKDGQLLVEINDLEKIYTFDATNAHMKETENCSK